MIEQEVDNNVGESKFSQLQSELQAARVLANEGLYSLFDDNEMFPALAKDDPDRLKIFGFEARVSHLGIQEKLYRADLLTLDEIIKVREQVGQQNPNYPAPWFAPNERERSILYTAQDTGDENFVRVALQIESITYQLELVATAEKRLSTLGLNGKTESSARDNLKRTREQLTRMLEEQSAKLALTGDH